MAVAELPPQPQRPPRLWGAPKAVSHSVDSVLQEFGASEKVERVSGLRAGPPKPSVAARQYRPNKHAHAGHLAAGLPEGQESERLLELRVEQVSKIEWHQRLAATAHEGPGFDRVRPLGLARQPHEGVQRPWAALLEPLLEQLPRHAPLDMGGE